MPLRSLKGAFGLATMAQGVVPTSEIGARSFSTLNGILLYMCGAIARLLMADKAIR